MNAYSPRICQIYMNFLVHKMKLEPLKTVYRIEKNILSENTEKILPLTKIPRKKSGKTENFTEY